MRSLLLACALLLAGCSSSSGDGDAATDAATDAAQDATTDAVQDSAVDAPAEADATCDVGAPPATPPALTSEFVILGDGGAAPTPSGGDPTGGWLVTHVTTYMPPATAGQVDAAMSQVSGTGWVVFDASSYRLAFDLDITLVTESVGTVRRGASTASRGSYSASGATIALAPECSTMALAGGSMLGFSRDADDRGRVFLTIGSAMFGDAVLVLDVTRAP